MKISEEIQVALNKLFLITDKLGDENGKLATDIGDVTVHLVELRNMCADIEYSVERILNKPTAG